MLRLLTLLALAAGLLVLAGCWMLRGKSPGDLEAAKRLVRTRFPEVQQLSTSELASWLEDPARRQPLILDVREAPEHAVSHLPGAVHVDPDATATDPVLADVDRETPIVTYCSIGYRSSALAQRLSEAGFTHVANLEGSIFAWANEGHPVERDGQVVRQVHPYDRVWGRLLRPELRADLDDDATAP